MGGEIRNPQGLLCHDYQNAIIDEEEDIIFVTKPKLFSTITIFLHEIVQYLKIINVEVMDIDVKTIIS